MQANPPFGGFATLPAAAVARVYMSPGPIFEPEGLGEDWWRLARALFAAGVRKGDIVHNTFAYHLTPGGWIFDSGARALGCAVIAAGPGNTEQQLEVIQTLKPTVYAGVPDYLKILLDKAKEMGRDASSIKKALVGGGALFPSLRTEYKRRGVATFQTYATADLGMIAYESPALEGMIIDEGSIVEIVRPGTGDPVPDGEVGEVVVTTFNRDYPMIRFAHWRSFRRAAGCKPVRPYQHAHQGMARARGSNHQDQGHVRASRAGGGDGQAPCRPGTGASRGRPLRRAGHHDPACRGGCDDPALKAKLAETLQAITKLKGEVELVPPNTLPNDGKVIADERTYT